MTKTKTIRKMSDTVIECELRAAWQDVACAIRHDIPPSRRLSGYIAALEAERLRRAGK